MSEHTATSPVAHDSDAQPTPQTVTDATGSKYRDRILLAIAGIDGTPIGQDVAAVLETYYESVSAGRLYPNLDDLAARGLIDKGDGPTERANAYELTEAGRQYLIEQVAWEAEQLGLAVQEADHWAAGDDVLCSKGGHE